MKQILLLFLLTSLLTHSKLYSQAVISGDGGIIYINKNQAPNGELEGKRGGYFSDHVLGDTIKLAYDKFLKLYVKYESEGGAYATERKTIYKEEIYKSVTKIEKSLVKLVKKNELSPNEAKKRLGNVLNSAIAIRFYNTSGFEDILKVTRDLEQQEKHFNSIKFTEN